MEKTRLDELKENGNAFGSITTLVLLITVIIILFGIWIHTLFMLKLAITGGFLSIVFYSVFKRYQQLVYEEIDRIEEEKCKAKENVEEN